jgi:quinoprotein glucose dehydrogenase
MGNSVHRPSRPAHPARCFLRVLLIAATLILPRLSPAGDGAPPGKLEVFKWSGDINVPDPVAVSLDPQGRAYVTQTTRRKVADLDIREHPQWIPFDAALEDIEQKKAFYHEVLAPGRMTRPEGDLRDHNKDGSIDWKDLTVHTERIYRLEDTTGKGVAGRKTVFAEGFNTEVTGIAAGVLWHDGAVYATIAPDLWRLRDTDGDGVADEREAIVHGFGHHIAYAGHDMHGLTIGLDGRIYWTIGDKGVNVHTQDGRHVMEPHQGCVLRCEPDGTGFEVFAHGIRNTQEIAFDDFGNIFGVDNDSDRPGEKERVVYLTEQSDSGWRCYYQYMKGYCPWMDEGLWKPRFAGQPEYITPPLANAHDGPAGFARNPGTALSHAWKDCFFYNQFPGGKMNVLRLQPSGAAFKVLEDRTVVSGVMGIGLTWSPDGKLYMADWAGGYPLKDQGAVWSVDDPTGTGSTERLETQKLLREGFAGRPTAELIALLAHPDQRVRREAQFQLVKLGEFAALKQTALDARQSTLARLHALWGLGQGLRSGKATPDEAQPLLVLVKDKDAEVRTQLAKILGDAPSCAALGDSLIPLLKDSAPRARFQAAIALGKLKLPGATGSILTLIEQNKDADACLRHAGVTGLAGCATREQLAKTAKHPSRAVRLAAVLALRRRADAAVADFLHDRDDGIVGEAARAIHDDGSIPEALPGLAALLDEKRAWPEAVARRSLNAAFRIGDARNAARVIEFALNRQAPAALREEALTLAQCWTTPPPLDRVDGRARKLGPRDSAVMAAVAQPRLQELMALGDPRQKTLGIQILTTYKLPVAADLAAVAVLEAKAPAEVRVEALRLLADQHSGSRELAETLAALFAGKTPEILRVEALNTQLLSDRAKAAAQAEKLLASGTTLEKQAALLALAKSQREEADAVLRQWLDQLLAGKVPPALQLDLLEAARSREALKEPLAAFEAQRASLAGTPGAFAECLEGGDAKAGKEIALTGLTANCTACHRFDKREGSNVGPPLDKIARTRDRVYLLESLITPNAKIAPGYGTLNVTLKDGSTLTGALVKADAAELQLRLADNTVKNIPSASVASKTEPVSVMPPMSLLLNKRQVRDVVAFLGSLKGSSGKEKDKKPAH